MQLLVAMPGAFWEWVCVLLISQAHSRSVRAGCAGWQINVAGFVSRLGRMRAFALDNRTGGRTLGVFKAMARLGASAPGWDPSFDACMRGGRHGI